MAHEEYDPVRDMEGKKFLLHDVLAAKQANVEHVGQRAVVPVNSEGRWHYEVHADGALNYVREFKADENEWVRVFVPSDAPYLAQFGAYPYARSKRVIDILEDKELSAGMDYSIAAVYQHRLENPGNIASQPVRPVGFDLFIRKGAFQDFAIDAFTALVEPTVGPRLSNWKNGTEKYKASFAFENTITGALVTNIIRNADFQEHSITRLANHVEKRGFPDLADRLRGFANRMSQDRYTPPGGTAMSF